MRLLLRILLAAMLVTGSVSGWAAAEASPSPAATPEAPARPFPFHNVVISVDPVARTFKIGKKVIRQVHVLPATRIMKGDGTAGAFELLAPGEEVRGAVRKRADGDWEAVSVKIGPKP